MRKLMYACLAAVLLCALAGCGSKKEEQESAAGMANPMAESSMDEIKELTGAQVELPSDAKDAKYFMYNGEMGEVQYTVDGTEFTLRAQKTDEFTDISGMYYEWDNSFDGTLGNCQEKDMNCKSDDGDVQVCLWYDKENKVMYSLSAVGKDLNGMDIQGTAMSVYKGK